MKNLIFKLRKATKKQMEEGVERNKGTQPWMHSLLLDYWCDNINGEPTGTLTLSRSHTIGSILEAVKNNELML